VNLKIEVSLVKSALERLQRLCRNNIIGPIILHVNNTVSKKLLINVMWTWSRDPFQIFGSSMISLKRRKLESSSFVHW